MMMQSKDYNNSAYDDYGDYNNNHNNHNNHRHHHRKNDDDEIVDSDGMNNMNMNMNMNNTNMGSMTDDNDNDVDGFGQIDDHDLHDLHHHQNGNGNGNGNGAATTTTTAAAASIDFDDPKIASLPRILLMGPRRGGKTSIQRVVFQKMSPHETLFRLEATQQLERTVVDHTPLCRFTVWDFPGDYYGGDGGGGGVDGSTNNGSGGEQQNNNNNNYYYDDNNNNNNNNNDELYKSVFAGGVGGGTATSTTSTTTIAAVVPPPPISLVFVVDAQDEPYDHVLQSFTNAVTRALSLNPNIVIEVFINKVDGELFLSDESKYDCRRDIMTQVTDELTDAGVSPECVHIRYHLTSIYDHSKYEALSRVVQRLIPQLPTLENLLNILVGTCSMEKAYLFDVVSKLYIGTDPGPVDMQSVELCSDMIDVVLDVSGIYGLGPSDDDDNDDNNNNNNNANNNNNNNNNNVNAHDGIGIIGDNNNNNNNNTLLLTTETGANDGANDSANDNANAIVAAGGPPPGGETKEPVDPDSAYDYKSASVIRLSNGMVLYLKEVDTMLALVCITRAENFRKKSLINYNIGCLKKALRALVEPAPAPTIAIATTTTTTTENGGV